MICSISFDDTLVREMGLLLKDNFLSLSLNIGTALANFQSSGRKLVSIECLKICARPGLMSPDINLSKAGLRLSGPVPLR